LLAGLLTLTLVDTFKVVFVLALVETIAVVLTLVDELLYTATVVLALTAVALA
jgi:hypothetical protein